MKEEAEMSQLNVLIPAKLKREIKADSVLQGVSLQDWVIEALRFYKNNPPEKLDAKKKNTCPTRAATLEAMEASQLPAAAPARRPRP